MQEQKTTVYVGIGTIMLALVLRLAMPGSMPLFEQKWDTPAPVQPDAVVQETAPTEEELPPTEPSTEPPTEPPLQILPGEAVLQLSDQTGYAPDVEALLLSPLSWQLRSDEPTVLIVHTHGTESYTKGEGEDYTESGAYRTLDAGYNMISVAEELTRVLEAGGIHVIHDRMLHDHPSYSGSYQHARESIASHLAAYPSIQMVIDLHRDALDLSNDPQLTTKAEVNGQPSSQLMLVAGTDRNASYPNWENNLSLGVKLMALLEKAHPGITRPIQLRPQRFNLDMSAGSLLIEVGANGDSHDQALVAVRALGEAILTLADGANLQNGPPF